MMRTFGKSTAKNLFSVALLASCCVASCVLLAETASAASAPQRSMPERPVQKHDIPQAFFLTQQATPTSNTALQFVEATGIYKNLSLLLLDEMKRSDTVEATIQAYGFEKVKMQVVSAIKQAQADHAQEWNSMLAEVYTSLFNDTELKSILKKKEQSPHFIKMLQKQEEIAASVSLSGKSILDAAQAQVLTILSEKLPV